jgi:hypothetical protein
MKSAWIETDVEPLPEPRSRQDYRHENSGSDGDGGIQGGVGRGNPGRPRGALNKTTRAIKEAAILAAECSEHSDGTLFGYLKYMSDHFPVTFTRSILSRLIPYHLNIAATAKLETAAEVRAKLVALGIPCPERLFPIPKVPDLASRRDPAPALERDEDSLRREPEPDHAGKPANGADPDPRARSGPWPVRDVRNTEVAIMAPGGAWHAMPGNEQLAFDYNDEKEPANETPQEP